MIKSKLVEISVNLRELIQIVSIDFTHTVTTLDSGTRLYFEFDVNPEDYLSFAKLDSRDGDKRGKINALSNAKRAIDSQIDGILKALGYECDPIPTFFSQFVGEFCDDDSNIPLKLRIISAFAMAPSGIISDIRTLRNKIEHEYRIPTDVEVKSSVEITELFLSATERHLINVGDFQLTDVSSHKEGYITGIDFSLDIEDSTIKAIYRERSNNKRYRCLIKPTSLEHAILMRFYFVLQQRDEAVSTLSYLLKCLNHPIPSNKVNISYME